MNKVLQEKIYNKYPLLFSNKDKSMQETCMYWGLCVGDGWYDLIDELCSKIEPIIQEIKKNNPDTYPKAAQVKEKFASLSFYMDHATDEIYKIIRDYSKKSQYICDRCGGPGQTMKVGGWLHAACETCLEKEGKKEISSKFNWENP